MGSPSVHTKRVTDLEKPGPQDMDPAPDAWTNEGLGWRPEDVQSRVNLDPADLVRACLSALTRHGLAIEERGRAEQRFLITQLGEAITVAMHGFSG